jgi:hypothetical protein
VRCGELTLKEAISVLYNITRVKDASVAGNLDFSSDSFQWNVSFIHTTHDWEVDILVSFCTLLYFHRVRMEGEDKLWWASSHKGKFVVSSFYKILACKGDLPFPWKSISRTKVPLKVFFFWLGRRL